MAEDGLDALFFYFYLFRFKMSPSPLVTTGIQVLPRYFRNSSLFTVNCKNSPSAAYVSATDLVRKDVDIFRKINTSLKHILR